MAPPNENGPEVTTPQGRPEPASLTTRVARRRRRPPQAYASLFAPDARRTRWMLTFICPHCKRGHRALALTEEIARVLRPRGACGRIVRIRVARTYRGGSVEKV
jgi:hypothetical protein